jgi:hypothetical protein
VRWSAIVTLAVWTGVVSALFAACDTRMNGRCPARFLRALRVRGTDRRRARAGHLPHCLVVEAVVDVAVVVPVAAVVLVEHEVDAAPAVPSVGQGPQRGGLAGAGRAVDQPQAPAQARAGSSAMISSKAAAMVRVWLGRMADQGSVATERSTRGAPQ